MTSEPLITLFTSPKPFTNPHINVIQRNAIRSWVELGDQVAVVLLGEEEGLAQAARDLNVLHLPRVDRNPKGTPLISSLFREARGVNLSPLLAYVNTDIILFPDFVNTAETISKAAEHFLMVGQRWDLEVDTPLQIVSGWEEQLRSEVRQEGNLHTPVGSDYFIFRRYDFSQIPPFAVGRAGWDNWMIYSGRINHIKVIDSTNSIFIIHQNHDYSHLEGGQIHRLQPETLENIDLMGGRFAVYSLLDADYRIMDGKIEKSRFTRWKIIREASIFPAVILKNVFLAKVFYIIFNLKRAIRDWRKDHKLRMESQ